MEYRLLEEVIDGCAKTGRDTIKAIEIYSQKHEEFVWDMQMQRADCNLRPIDYAVSFMRDYLWFGDEH